MQLRIKLSNSTFDPVTGRSIVTVKTKRGTYTGVAKTHPDDKEIQSKYTGLRIAEMKAVRKAYKDELKRERIILHTIERMTKDIIHNIHDSSYDEYLIMRTIRLRFHYMTEYHKRNINLLKKWIESINHSLEDNKKHLQHIKEKRSKK